MPFRSSFDLEYRVRSVHGYELIAIPHVIEHRGNEYIAYFALYKSADMSFVGSISHSQFPASLCHKMKEDGFRKSAKKAAGFYTWWRPAEK